MYCSFCPEIRTLQGKNRNSWLLTGFMKLWSEMKLSVLQMGNVSDYKLIDDNYFINTGSPHYIVFTDDVDKINVSEEGKKTQVVR